MKKLLLATSFLVTGAGFAAAEVTLTGDGRMGIVYNGDDWNFSSRARVKFNLSGETDTGLSFGAGFRADQATGSASGYQGSIWISGAFGKIEMGDTISAAETVIGDLPEIGFTDLDSLKLAGASGANEGDFLTGDSEDGITGANNPSLLYTYTFDAFTVAASLTDGNQALSSLDDDQAYSLGFKYAAGNYSASIAHEVLDYSNPLFATSKATWIAGTADFNGTKIYALYGDFKDRGNWDNQLGLGLESTFGDVGVAAYVKQTNLLAFDAAVGDDSILNYGIGASYDLGGGASVVGGIADSDALNSDAVADLGVKFKF